MLVTKNNVSNTICTVTVNNCPNKLFCLFDNSDRSDRGVTSDLFSVSAFFEIVHKTKRISSSAAICYLLL